MAIWITILIGSIIGGLWGNSGSPRSSGRFGNMLLGITGALSARWLVDVLSVLGLRPVPYEIILTLLGAALLPWCFHGFEHSLHIRWRKSTAPNRIHTLPSPKDSDSHSQIPAA